MNRKDHIRKKLHVAILVETDGIDPGAQVMSRLAEGQNSPHLPSQMDMAVRICKLMKTEKYGNVVSESGEDISTWERVPGYDFN